MTHYPVRLVPPLLLRALALALPLVLVQQAPPAPPALIITMLWVQQAPQENPAQ